MAAAKAEVVVVVKAVAVKAAGATGRAQPAIHLVAVEEIILRQQNNYLRAEVKNGAFARRRHHFKQESTKAAKS
jgi:hypothetical protein